MFREYFGVAEDPFSITPDTRYLFHSERHRNAFAHLLYGVAHAGGFVQLTGEIGTGKTLLCRNLLAQVPDDVHVALIFNPRLTPLELVASICDEFKILYPLGCRSIKEIVDFLNAYLLERHRQGYHTVVIIDEAQNLSFEALEQVRLLTNLETEKEKLLQIILVGQPELRQLLAKPELRQLAQRITARCHLTPLSAGETDDYVRHRLRVAGADERLFTADALRQIYRLSGGVPRLINVLCGRAMLAAFGVDRRIIDGGLVKQVAKELSGEREATKWGWRWGWGLTGIAGLLVLVFLGYLFLKVPQGTMVKPVAALTVTQPDREESAQTRLIESDRLRVQPAVAHGVPAQPQSPLLGPQDSIEAGAAQVVPAKEPSDGIEPQPSMANPAARSDASLSFEGLLGDQHAAFATLFAYWQRVYPMDDASLSACERAERVGMSCIYGRGDWQSLARYNRPAVIELQLDDGHSYHVVVVGLDAQRVTLDLASRRLNVSRQEIEPLWSGSYIVLWRPPNLSVATLEMGMQGRDVAWLVSRLDRIEGVLTDYDPQQVRFDQTVKQRVMEFQQSQGLIADGVVGRQTIIQLSMVAVDTATPALFRSGG